MLFNNSRIASQRWKWYLLMRWNDTDANKEALNVEPRNKREDHLHPVTKDTVEKRTAVGKRFKLNLEHQSLSRVGV